MDAERLLSHGQRQLFCLAQAILDPAKIVVLHEVMASVDLQTDELMQKINHEKLPRLCNHCGGIQVTDDCEL